MSKHREQVAWKLSRAGALETNPASFSQRASTFSASAAALGGATLLVVRDGEGMTGYLVAPDVHGVDKAALHLGHAVGGKVSRCEQAPDLSDTAVVASLQFEPGSSVARETQAGVDPGEAARRLAVSLSPGQWVAVTLRAPSRAERARHLRWLRVRLGTASPTHHSITNGAVVISVLAGGADKGDVAHLLAQVQAAMPGFDLEAHAHVPGARGLAGLLSLGGLASWGAGLAGLVPMLAGGGVGAGLTTAGLLAAVGFGGGRMLRRVDLAGAVLPAPPARLSPPRRPRKKKDPAGEVTQLEGDYPLAREGFMVAANVIVGLVAPQAGALSGGTSTLERATSAVLTNRIGPMVGHGGDGELVHLSAADQVFGVAVIGRPGSGKSVLVRALYAWALQDRLAPSGAPGFPGARNTLIAFESKGQDGAGVYRAWGRALGQEPTLVELLDPTTPAIDMFAVPGTVRERANFFVNALQYAFDDGSIRDQSFTTLSQVFTAALAITPELAASVERLDPAGSPVYFAHVLLGGMGDDLGVQLAGTITAEANRLQGAGAPPGPLTLARDALGPLYLGKTESARRSILQAPANKIDQLMAAESWWSPARPKVSWAQVVDAHANVVINTGVSAGGVLVSDKLTGLMSSLLMYGLRTAIMSTCSGWLEQGRSVSIFADELSLLAGSSPEVITWLRNQGRSYGVRPVMATQYPEQLDQAVRTALMSFSTMICFTQDNARVAEEVAADARADGSEWTSADVVNLPRYWAIVRASVGQTRVTPCTVQTAYFEDDMGAFVSAQTGAGA